MPVGSQSSIKTEHVAPLAFFLTPSSNSLPAYLSMVSCRFSPLSLSLAHTHTLSLSSPHTDTSAGAFHLRVARSPPACIYYDACDLQAICDRNFSVRPVMHAQISMR